MKKVLQWIKSLSLVKQLLLEFAFIVIIAAGSSGNHPTTLNATNSKSTTDAAQNQDTSNHQAPKAPVVTTSTEDETQAIPFTSTTVQTSSLAKGTTKITTAGVNGSQTLTYKITTTNGVQTSKDLVSTTITLQSITQVTSAGTYVAPAPTQPKCDPNYSGACVPDVYPSDVDCAGGSGNGPYYVQGPVTVIGTDIYHLDADGNGIGCE